MTSSTPSTPFPTARLDELPQLDPTHIAPPLLTTDADQHDVGAAHGRVLPLIGQWRPYILDINASALTGLGVRVYADTAEDAVAAMLGGKVAAAIAELQASLADLGPDPAPETALTADDLLLIGDDDAVEADVATVPELDEETKASYALFQAQRDRVEVAQMQVAALLADHATGVRLRMQRQVNAGAVDSGQWGRLDEQEREELMACAADGEQGRRPFGIPEEVPFVDDEDQESEQLVVRGEWRSDVPLVCVRTDYLPFTGAPAPLSVVTGYSADGSPFWAPGEPNLTWLDPSNPADYLTSLAEVGLVEIMERPVDHAMELMRPWLAEKRRRDLEQARAAAAGSEQ